MLQLVGKPWRWLLLMIIPYIGVIWSIWMINLLAKRFGKEEGFTVGLILLPFIFWPILGFGSAEFTPLDSQKLGDGAINEAPTWD